jgi:hypothetical protein
LQPNSAIRDAGFSTLYFPLYFRSEYAWLDK